MIYLLLSIVSNTLLFIILKYFGKYTINNLQAIVVNYICACLLGLVNNSSSLSFSAIPHAHWTGAAIALGCLFIIGFLLMAKTAQDIGVSVTTVANKMAVIIPVSAALFLYHDKIGFLKLVGIALALVAVFLTSRKPKRDTPGQVSKTMMVLLPLLVFLGGGITDSLVNYSQKALVPEAETSLFVSCFFGTASLIGIAAVAYRMIFLKEAIALRTILGGVILGLVNYCSIYFMIKALNTRIAESSVLYPVNNMGIVLLSAVGGLILFREKLSAMNLTGIALSLVAIALIAFS